MNDLTDNSKDSAFNMPNRQEEQDVNIVDEPIPHLDRGNLITTINSLFAKYDIVLLEGEDGIGRTTIAKDFAEFQKSRVIPAFIHPATRWGYDPGALQEEFAEAMLRFLGRPMPDPDHAISTSEYHELIADLHRRCRRIKEPIYFVIDGIDELPEKESSLRQSLLDAIPFGFEGFKFLISWNYSFAFASAWQEHTKSFPVPSVGNTEAKALLQGIDLKDEQVLLFNTLSRGIPGRLAAVRRLLRNHVSINASTCNVETFERVLIDLEWQQVVSADELNKQFLAMVAYNPAGVSIAQLEMTLEQSAEEIVRCVNRFKFLMFSGSTVRFLSEQFRVHAQFNLQTETREILNKRIDRLLAAPHEPQSLEELPSLLGDAQRYSELLELLSPEFYQAGIEKKKSLVTLKRSNAVGIAAAQSDQRDTMLLQFCFNNCIFNELSMAELWKAEVNARMSIGDFDNAFKVANSAPLNEDRLCLLALVAKLQQNKQGSVDSELLDSIRQAYAVTELDFTEQKTVQLATDLIAVLPDIAVKISNRLQGSRQGIEADVAIASIIMQADFMENPENAGKLSQVEEVRNQIVSPQVRVLSEVAPKLLGGDTDVDEILRESEKIQSLKLRLPLLEAWVARNRKSPSSSRAAEQAIQMMLTDSKFLPTCRNFRRLLFGLPFCTDAELRNRILETTASVMETLEKRGPTLDYVRLQLLLLETAKQYDPSDAFDVALDNLVAYVNQLALLGARAECRAAVWAFLHRTGDLRFNTISEQVLKDLLVDFESLLIASANHFVAARVIVESLARGSLAVACDFSKELNTERRRDQAVLVSLNAASRGVEDNVDLRAFCDALECIADPRQKYSAVVSVLRNLVRALEVSGCSVTNTSCIVGLVHTIDNASVCVAALTNLRLLIEFDSSENSGKLTQNIEEWLLQSWGAIDRLWDRIRSGYEIVAVVGQRLKQLAGSYLDSTDALKKESSILAPETAWAAISSVRLVIAALHGLMHQRLTRDDDLARLKQLIDAIPSLGEQALLWADFAQRLVITGDNEGAERIVSQHISPLLNQIADGDKGFKDFVWTCAPQVFWATNPVLCREHLETLPRQLRDEAYANLCYFLIRKEPLFEPISVSSMANLKPNHNCLVNVIDLMHLIEDDGTLSSLIETIVDAVEEGRGQFTHEQSADIASRLESIVKKKFPCKHGISHDGYSIYCRANIGRLGRLTDWQKLQRDALNIPNAADRCFVVSKVASHLPTKHQLLRDQLLQQALADTFGLPACFDRVQGLSNIASIYERVDKRKCKQLFIDAMRLTCGEDGRHVAGLQRHLVDLSHRIDPDIAQELLSTLDSDPARIQARQELKHELEVLSATRNVRKTVQKGTPNRKGFRDLKASASDNSPNVDVLPSMAWRALAQLNGGAGLALSLTELRDYFVKAAELPLSASFPVLNWTISCISKLYADKPQASTTIRTVCESAFASANLCLGLIARCSTDNLLHGAISFHKSSMETGIIRAGDSLAGFAIIRQWIENDAEEFILLCDPYFDLEDLEILRFVLEARKDVTVTIVSDLKRYRDGTPADVFNAAWNRLMAVVPPITDILLMTTEKTQVFPIHDRWMVSRSSGLRIGTSLNGLGARKASEISKVDSVKADEYRAELNPFIGRAIRIHSGERLQFVSFSLE